MDFELTLATSISRHLPPLRGSRRLALMLSDLYNRKPRQRVVSRVRGFHMTLDPSEYVDRHLLFCPQLYDSWEFSQIAHRVQPGQTVLDLGAHIGAYSLFLSNLVGPGGRVLAFEAWPPTFRRLLDNLERNQITNVAAYNIGLSDSDGLMPFYFINEGNNGRSSMFYRGDGTLAAVNCTTLSKVVNDAALDRIDFIKMDIEDMEYRVMKKFFETAQSRLYPRVILAEHNAEHVAHAGGDLLELLARYGYRQISRSPPRTEPNFLFEATHLSC